MKHDVEYLMSSTDTVRWASAKRSWLFVLAMSIVWVCPNGWGFFDEEVPTQKMVLSRYHTHSTSQGSKANVSEPKVNSVSKSQKEPLLSTESEPQKQPGDAALGHQTQHLQEHDSAKVAAAIPSSKVRIVPPPSAVPTGLHTDPGREPMPAAPYEIVPEQGQPVVQKQPTVSMLDKNSSKPDVDNQPYAFNKVMQWVNEVAMVMFTYSGEHMDRDKKNVAQYFSPEAWHTVDQFLFAHKDSPFLQLKKNHGNSKGISLDWPKTLQADISKRGRIWWLKVPVSVIVNEKNRVRRVLYEVKLGVMPITRNGESHFLAEEVLIKQVSVQKSRRVRRRW